MIEKVKTNDVEIRINAKVAGDYGFLKIGGVERTPEQERRECEDIVSNIKRHVDNVGWIGINQKELCETEDGQQFETMYEALAHLYDDEDSAPHYRYSYKRDTDQYGTSGTTSDFTEIICQAYKTPWNFTVTGAELTEAQQLFLNNVLTASLAEKTVLK